MMAMRTACRLFVAGIFLMILMGASPLFGQQWETVDSVGAATLLRAQGPEIGRSRPQRGGGSSYPALHYAWYAVQDSSMGLVFSAPSGMKAYGRSDDSGVDGDFFLRSTVAPVRAFEVRAITFDLWRDQNRTLTTTEMNPRWDDDGGIEDYDPRWSDPFDRDRHLALSVVWVANVMLEDGTLLAYDVESVLEAVRLIGVDVSSEDLIAKQEEPDG